MEARGRRHAVESRETERGSRVEVGSGTAQFPARMVDLLVLGGGADHGHLGDPANGTIGVESPLNTISMGRKS